jgi:hypothetical protein
MEIDKSGISVSERKEAINLAIKEIEAYNAPTLTDGYTERLIASAKTIAEYIKLGPN